jgi:hypothetical protein
MHTTASIGIGSVQPGQGRVPATAACRPISSNRLSALATGTTAACSSGIGLALIGFAAAGLAAAALGAALAGGPLAAAPLAGAAAPIVIGSLHLGHLTVLPANSSLAAKAAPQEH